MSETSPEEVTLGDICRKKVMQDQLEFDRKCERQKKIWMNRGLPVNSEVLPTKDAFDLRDLNESLPSTSEKSNAEMSEREKRFESLKLLIRQKCDKMLKFDKSSCHLSSYTSKLSRGMPHGFGFPIIDPIPCQNSHLPNSIKEEIERKMISAKFLIMLRREHHKRLEQQNKINEAVAAMKMNLQGQTQKTDLNKFDMGMLNCSKSVLIPCTKITEMCLDDKEDTSEKKQDSDYENNQRSSLCALLTRVPQEFEQGTSCDPEKTWVPDFQPPHASVPCNSPIKKDENIDKSLKLSRAERLQKSWMEVQSLRQQRRLKFMYSYREQRCRDLGETGNSSLGVLDSIQSRCNSVSSPENRTVVFRKMMGCMMLGQKMSESGENHRLRRFRFSPHAMKSDKVIPD